MLVPAAARSVPARSPTQPNGPAKGTRVMASSLRTAGATALRADVAESVSRHDGDSSSYTTPGPAGDAALPAGGIHRPFYVNLRKHT